MNNGQGTTIAWALVMLLLLTVACRPSAAQVQPMAEGEIVKLLGHTDLLFSIDYSPDGSRVVTASRDRTMRIWDASTGAELLRVTDSTSEPFPFSHALYSGDGNRIVTWNGSGLVRVWNATTGDSERTLSGHTKVITSGAVSPDGRKMITGSGDATARIWDIITGEELYVLTGQQQNVRSVAFSPDGRYVFTASLDGIVKVWDIENEKDLQTFPSDLGMILWASFSPSGDSIVISGQLGLLKLLDVKTGSVLHTYSVNTKIPILFAEYSPDGRWIVFGPQDKTVRIWEAVTEREVYRWVGGTKDYVTVAFTRDGKRLAISGFMDTAYIWTLPPEPTTSVASDAVTGDGDLLVCRPNPVASESEILYSHRASGRVRLAIVDALGREVRVVVDGAVEAGRHTARVDWGDLPNGLYFCVLRSGGASRTIPVRR